MKRTYKYVGGFITIEYTLLVPVLLVLYTFLVYIAIYQYNQSLMRTNVYLLENEGKQMIYMDAPLRVSMLKSKETQLYNDKYLLMEEIHTKYHIRNNFFKISSGGQMGNPLRIAGIGQDQWQIKYEREFNIIEPAEILKLCKLIRHVIHIDENE